MGVLQYVPASWVPYHKHYVIRSIPLCGVKVLYLAQIVSLDNQLWATAKKEEKWYPV